MSLIRWKSRTDKEREKAEQETVKSKKEKYKGRSINSLSQNEYNELVEMMAKDLGYL